MHEKKIGWMYHRELLSALVIYTVILIVTIQYGRGMAEGVARTLVLASPMAGFLLAIWAIARHMRRIDEYQRQFQLENIALAGAITAGLTFTYGFMETAGYPKLSMFSVWMVMCGAWGVIGCARAWWNR